MLNGFFSIGALDGLLFVIYQKYDKTEVLRPGKVFRELMSKQSPLKSFSSV